MPKLYKAMDVRKFKKFVEDKGYIVVFDTDHSNEILDKDGNLVCTFAIDHQKGSKKIVKPGYVKNFIKIIT